MLSIVLPTYNEAKNIESVIADISAMLSTIDHEIIIADDDSPDGTWKIAEALKKHYPQIVVIRRTVNRGLGPAVVDGFRQAKGDVLMVMDADGQHDPKLIPLLYDKVHGGATVAVASRYVPGGSVGDWVSGRRLLSKCATRMAGWVSVVPIADPMSGFFALNANTYQAIAERVRPLGFKILLEILAHLPHGSTGVEIPLHFRVRTGGESKLSMRVQFEFLWQVLRLATMRMCTSWMGWFVAVSVIIAALLISRLLVVLPLITDPGLRENVQHALTAASQRDGLLASGMSIQRITHSYVDIQYRDYHRGPDQKRCLRLPFGFAATQTCAE